MHITHTLYRKNYASLDLYTPHNIILLLQPFKKFTEILNKILNIIFSVF